MLTKAVWLFFIAFIVLLIFLPGYSKLQELKQKNSELETKIEETRDENVQLREEKKKLEEDIVYLEKVAREKMGLVRDGEIIYRLVPEEEE